MSWGNEGMNQALVDSFLRSREDKVDPCEPYLSAVRDRIQHEEP
jgi:hypothetical protein